MSSDFVAEAFCTVAGAENQAHTPHPHPHQVRISHVKHSDGKHKFFNPKALSKNLPRSEKYRCTLGPNHSDHREVTHALDTTQPRDEPMQIPPQVPEELSVLCCAPTKNLQQLNCLPATSLGTAHYPKSLPQTDHLGQKN